VVEAVNADHANPLFLPDIALDASIRATGVLAEIAGPRPNPGRPCCPPSTCAATPGPRLGRICHADQIGGALRPRGVEQGSLKLE